MYQCTRACHFFLEIAGHALEEILLGIIQMTPIVVCIAALTSLTGLAADVVAPIIFLMTLMRHEKCNQNGGEQREQDTRVLRPAV